MIRQFLGFIQLPVVAVFACTPASLMAQTDLRGEPTIYRLPLKIDGEYVPTGILLKVDTHEFTVQEDAHVRTLQTRGSPEGGLSALFRAVANDDFGKGIGVAALSPLSEEYFVGKR